MTKFTYIFICLLLSVGFWQISFLQRFLLPDMVLALTWLWALSSFYFFRGRLKINSIYASKYKNYVYYVFAGVFISMFSAYFFWGQSLITTLITQRQIYSFILLPAILFVQPENNDIIKALKWISIGTIIIWGISVFNPNFVSIDERAIAWHQSWENAPIGYYISGIYFVVLYLYFKIQEYINKFSWDSFLQVSFLLVFFVLYNNRSLLLGIIPIFIYSIIKFKSKYKIIQIFILSSIIIVGITYSWNIFESFFQKTQNELNNSDYNRWKSLNYFFNEYSPNWFCYLFGNGFPSGGNSSFGNLMWDNFENGIYASDLGMIGMWTTYGLLPLTAIYSVIIKVLNGKMFPLYLKFICIHVLFVPTIFEFWGDSGLFMFVLIIYLFAYYTERSKLLKRYIYNYNHHKVNVQLGKRIVFIQK